MDTLKEFFKIGAGPSSSHTIGPERATKRVKEKFPDADSYIVELWGSLAATGKGHYTDKIIIETFKPIPVEIIWKPEFVHELHTNGMKFIALDKDKNQIGEWIVFSVGGGTIRDYDELMDKSPKKEVYPLNSIKEIIKWCKDNNKHLWQYVEECEGPSIWQHLRFIDQAMSDAVQRGLEKNGDVPGPFKYPKRAREMYEKALSKRASLVFTNKIFAYALAVSEENASMGQVVTAPTCGASGVVPGVLRAMKEEYELVEKHILRGLAIAGLIGNLVKHNATISGAEGGCQAEVGTACSMAAAMATYFMGGNIDQIEYAAESAMEHHLGMTCDPVGGYVIIPCIERNAICAVRAVNTAVYCMSTDGKHTISFDEVVKTMKETGKDMCSAYKETSDGGLAKYYDRILVDNKE
ncbi:L-serine ammonia-lyase, iron-sulfur-dependent, subunit alpha [Fusobacterium polymorphum]|uniref:L-serine ammonia-lyase, iron-sulfur-dependent, subunit alpha n=1 Tax=Fusobacterium nucleatum subsp. polymorphum TaxID=76857 RepID=UPI001EEFCDF5|nr:L-serine ammonia-lyase, iron-sulfur-dependent, subunit alpha [Fusobacterium nucleatum]MCG6838100.1 L-serine ammonia-lyase, iron-sulfur-dependent, subunit alpha [Fusobacterium nucleatum]